MFSRKQQPKIVHSVLHSTRYSWWVICFSLMFCAIFGWLEGLHLKGILNWWPFWSGDRSDSWSSRTYHQTGHKSRMKRKHFKWREGNNGDWGGINWELEMKEKIFHDSVIMWRVLNVPTILMRKYTPVFIFRSCSSATVVGLQMSVRHSTSLCKGHCRQSHSTVYWEHYLLLITTSAQPPKSAHLFPFLTK